MSLSKDTKRRLAIALTSVPAANDVIGSLGQYGSFRIGAGASVASVLGDISAAPDSGGAPGTYRVYFPNINASIQSIAWYEVAGFTPRNPTTAETDIARTTGFNFDSTLNQWYITVQIALLSNNAVDPTPPVGFVVAVRAAFVINPSANQI